MGGNPVATADSPMKQTGSPLGSANLPAILHAMR